VLISQGSIIWYNSKPNAFWIELCTHYHTLPVENT
jgi:hypothetical protein